MLARSPPAHLAAEQALLGAILANNKAYDLVGDLTPDHFADEVHAEIFRAIARRINAGRKVDALTLKPALENTGLMADEGGVGPYLVKLLAAMISIDGVSEYARVIMDCALRRSLIVIGESLIESAHGISLSDGDAANTAAMTILEIERASAASGSTAAVSLSRAIELALKKSEAAGRDEAGAGGIMTTLPSLDARWGGLYPASLEIIGARSGVGKTVYASQLGRLIAAQNIPVAFFSLEVPAAHFGMSQLASIARIPVDRLRAGKFSTAEAERLIAAQRELSALPFTVVDKADTTLAEAIAEMRLLKRRQGCRVFFIDHRNKLGRDAGYERMSKLDWYGHITDSLKRAAKQLDVVVVLLCQLTRDVLRRPDPRPIVADLEYAGEQDADNIQLIFRPAFHMTQPPERGNLSAEAHANILSRWYADRKTAEPVFDVIFAKRRFGEPGTVRLHFDAAFGIAFEPPVDPLSEMPPGLWG